MADLCLIKKVEFNEDSIKPIIVNFENGTIETGQEKNLLCRLYTGQGNSTHIAAATEKMLYTGDLKTNDLYNTFIAVCNKKKTKMRLYGVDHATLSPYFKEDKIGKRKSLEMVDSSAFELNKQFGSKKVKRKMEQTERMKMDIETVKEKLEQTVQDIKINTADVVLSKDGENETSYKPRINREAEVREEVYDIDDIVSPNVLNSFSEEANRILKQPDSEINASAFIKYQIKNLMNSESKRIHLTLQLLLYIDCLIKFVGRQAKELNTKSLKLCAYSAIAQEYILKRYTILSGKSRLRPASMRDKCVCSILVLSMIACKYKLNLEIIGKELKLGLKKLQDVCRVLAFTVNKDIAILSLPLPPPVSRFSGKKKKKQ